MDFVRIGDKVINRQKLEATVNDILSSRAKGMSQAEVAAKLGIDRTFISRLESLGEIRKGGSIALIGFPLSNCDEVRRLAEEEGVDFTFVMTDEERWKFVKERSGGELLNEIMQLITQARGHSKVILIGSDRRLDITRGMFDSDTEIAEVVIGRSPMAGDVHLNIELLREIIRGMKGN